MSQKSGTERGIGRGKSTSSGISKQLKRDFELVSPASPDSPLTMAGIRELLKEELRPVAADLDSLKKSIDFATDKLDQIEALGKQVKDLESANKLLSHTIQKQDRKIHDLEEKVIACEGMSRRYNLRFLNVKGYVSANGKEDCEDIIARICHDQGINLAHRDIECAHKIGFAGKSDRPILVRFHHFKTRLAVLMLKNEFKNKGIIIQEDFPVEVLRRRRLFAPVLKGAFASNGHYKAKLNGDKLILNGQQYTTNDLHKLPQEIQPDKLTTIKQGNYIAFFITHSKLSNHYPAPFMQDGTRFESAEHFYTFKMRMLNILTMR